MAEPHLIARGPLTAYKAARTIVVITTLVTIAGGILIWLVDHREFSDLGTSLWWSLQTVTTVGYGDVVPAQTGGRVIGAVAERQLTRVFRGVLADLERAAPGKDPPSPPR